MMSLPEMLGGSSSPEFLFFPSQGNAVDTQQPLQNPGPAAPGWTEHAHHSSSDPQRLQQQPLGVRALRSSDFDFCFTLLCVLIILRDLKQQDCVMDLHFLLNGSRTLAKKMYWKICFVRVDRRFLCVCLNFPNQTSPFVVRWRGWR